VATASMKMNVIGVPGYMGIAQWMGMIPGMTPFATGLMNSQMKGPGVTARWVDCCPEQSQAVAGTSRHNPTGLGVAPTRLAAQARRSCYFRLPLRTNPRQLPFDR